MRTRTLPFLLIPAIAALGCTSTPMDGEGDRSPRVSLETDRTSYSASEEVLLQVTNVGPGEVEISGSFLVLVVCGEYGGPNVQFDWSLERNSATGWESFTIPLDQPVFCFPIAEPPDVVSPGGSVTRAFPASPLLFGEGGEFRIVRSFEPDGTTVTDHSNPFTIAP
jgi:hypothetical protein